MMTSHRLLHNVHIFFFNDTATTEIYTLSLHDALPIYKVTGVQTCALPIRSEEHTSELQSPCNLVCRIIRSEEHTSELQSPCNLVCRLLLEKKKKNTNIITMRRSYTLRLRTYVYPRRL